MLKWLKNNFYIIIIIILVMIGIFNAINFQASLTKLLSDNLTATLKTYTENEAEFLENFLASQAQTLEAVSIEALHGNFDLDDASEGTYKDGLSKVAIYYIDKEDAFANTELLDVLGQDGIQATLDNYYTILESKESSKTATLATCVYDDGELKAITTGDLYYSYLADALVTNDAQGVHGIVMNTTGQVLFQTKSGSPTSSSNFFDALEYLTPEDGASMAQIQKDIASHEEFYVELSVQGENNRDVLAIPLDNSNWYLVYAVPESSIKPENAAIQQLANGIIFSFITIALLCLALVFMHQRKEIKKLERIANYDSLTGCYSVSKFKHEAVKALTKYPDENFTIVKVDIVNFKSINELYGFNTGNEVIKAFVDTGNTIKYDNFFQCRVAVDELLIFARASTITDIDATTEEYEEYFKKRVSISDFHEFKFRYGRYLIPSGEKDINTIINKANMAHHIAKKRNMRIIDFSDKINNEMIFATEITNKMVKALENEEFKVHLQAKVQIDTLEVVGAEALVRWQQSDGSFIYPSDFIPIFENNKFICELDFYMLRKVAQYQKECLQSNAHVVPISVNFSRIHLENQDSVARAVRIVDEVGIPHDLIEIELTESALVGDMESILDFESELHAHGFLLSMDDFGSGYSSFETLQKISFDLIKIDRSLILNHENSEKHTKIFRAIVEMISNLGGKSVAEGVETKEQFDLLSAVNCQIAQGYYFHRPVPIDEFSKAFREIGPNKLLGHSN